MRGLSSIPKVLSPTHGCPSDEPRNKCLLRCCWPQLLQGTPVSPLGLPRWAGGGGSSRPCSREQWPKIVVGLFFFFFFFHMRKKLAFLTRQE